MITNDSPVMTISLMTTRLIPLFKLVIFPCDSHGISVDIRNLFTFQIKTNYLMTFK